jgi:heme-degrading monooxygenase HmoA
MYVIIWEYRVKADHVAEFEKIYASNGAWTELFSKDAGYQGTEFLQDLDDAQRYITIDRWISSGAYDAFLAQWHKEYEALDVCCKDLTEQDNLMGRGESITHATR